MVELGEIDTSVWIETIEVGLSLHLNIIYALLVKAIPLLELPDGQLTLSLLLYLSTSRHST